MVKRFPPVLSLSSLRSPLLWTTFWQRSGLASSTHRFNFFHPVKPDRLCRDQTCIRWVHSQTRKSVLHKAGPGWRLTEIFYKIATSEFSLIFLVNSGPGFYFVWIWSDLRNSDNWIPKIIFFVRISALVCHLLAYLLVCGEVLGQAPRFATSNIFSVVLLELPSVIASICSFIPVNFIISVVKVSSDIVTGLNNSPTAGFNLTALVPKNSYNSVNAYQIWVAIVLV